jgi:hypothetical protein
MSTSPRNTRALTGHNSMSMAADLTGLDALLNQLGDDVEAATRPAAQAGSQVIYDQVVANVAALGRSTGNLARSIYQAYSATNSAPGKATYQVSWNHRKAPHGHLVEWGYIRRYESYQDEQGNIRMRVQPGMQGKPKPRRKASQAEKDAYYVPLDGGPVQVAGKAFVRRAESAFDRAYQAAEAELLRRIQHKAGAP